MQLGFMGPFAYSMYNFQWHSSTFKECFKQLRPRTLKRVLAENFTLKAGQKKTRF